MELSNNFTATVWRKNGDHPNDGEVRDSENYPHDLRVVRYYRHPGYDGKYMCPQCRHLLHTHGWIDSGGHGQVVCPGSVVVSTDGEHYVMTRRAANLIPGVTAKLQAQAKIPRRDATFSMDEATRTNLFTSLQENLASSKIHNTQLSIVNKL